jgi:hypothetical protein
MITHQLTLSPSKEVGDLLCMVAKGGPESELAWSAMKDALKPCIIAMGEREITVREIARAIKEYGIHKYISGCDTDDFPPDIKDLFEEYKRSAKKIDELIS